MEYILSISLIRMILGRGKDVWPKDLKAICISLIVILTYFHFSDWNPTNFCAVILGIVLYCKLPARNRYVAITEKDQRDYSKDWLKVCWMTDKILGTKPNTLMSAQDLIKWGCVCAALQGLVIGFSTYGVSQFSWFGLMIGVAGSLQGFCLYLARFAPDKERYGGILFDFLTGLLMSSLIVVASDL